MPHRTVASRQPVALAAVALVYQLVLFDPRGYSVLHNLCQGLMVVPTLVLAVRLALADDGTAAHPPALRRLLYGTLLGFVAPGVILGTSGFTGGDLPVSMAAWFNFVFPLACMAALRGPRLPALALA